MKCEKNERARVPRITGGAGGYLGRYVYDSGGADLGCGVAMSDYDVRSSRCTLACPGCVLEAAG